MVSVQSSKGKVTTYGTIQDGIVITVNEDKLTLEYIKQIRNYLDVQEKRLKSTKNEKRTRNSR